MFIKAYLSATFERVFVNSVPLMDLNTYLNLPLKLEMLKVKVKDKDRN